MTGTVNGIGTMVCPGRGEISWTPGPWYLRTSDFTEFDGVECFCVLYLPLVPFKCIHVFGRKNAILGEQYQTVPLRWSNSLIGRAFLERWLYLLIPVGLVTSGYLFTDMFLLGLFGLGILIHGIICWCMLFRTDQRHRDLRRVMGTGIFGSSDPATWAADFLAQTADARSMFGTSTFGAAALGAISRGEFARAMQAARFCAAVEDRDKGEALTNDILNFPAVQRALLQTHADPVHWKQQFGKCEVEELVDFV